MSLSKETLVRSSITRFCAIFPKCLLKVSNDFISSEITFIFNQKVILSSFKNKGFPVLQNSLVY